MVTELVPKISKSFDLGKFIPSLKDLVKFISGLAIDQEGAREFEMFVIRRIIFLVKSRLIAANDRSKDRSWGDFGHDDFTELVDRAMPLVGQIINYELRKLSRFPNFYFYFDQTKALQVWNYWNKLHIDLTYNALIPKGEIGINPASGLYKYRAFQARHFEAGGDVYLEPTTELGISIEPKLVEIQSLLLSNKTYEKKAARV